IDNLLRFEPAADVFDKLSDEGSSGRFRRVRSLAIGEQFRIDFCEVVGAGPFDGLGEPIDRFAFRDCRHADSSTSASFTPILPTTFYFLDKAAASARTEVAASSV